MLFEGRFVVESFEVGGSAGHAKMDDALYLGWVVESIREVLGLIPERVG
jgi:hypothetical protein